MENSERDGNTRPPDLPLQKSVCRSGSNSYSRTRNNRLVPNREVQFSFSVVSASLRPHESQHARPPYPSPTAGVYSNSCPSSRWCHPAISSSVISFCSCSQSLPASGSFPMSQLFTWGGQSIRVSASASVLRGKGVHKVCILSPCLFNLYAEYIMLGWMDHKLESRLLGEISITSDMQMTPPLWQKVKKN